MKTLLSCCALALAIASVSGAHTQLRAFGPGGWGPAHSGLRMAISSRPPTTGSPGEPEFSIGIENVGSDDVVLNLGCMLANGKVMFPEAVRLLLSDAQGNTRELLYSDKRYPGIAGRVDDFIVSLRAGSVYTIRVSMDQYWSPSTKEWDLTLAPGQYRIEARFEGQGAQFPSLDIRGVALLNFWKGTLRSNVLSFEVP
jgi:hypothetical protein